MPCLVFRRRQVAQGLQEPLRVEPGDPFQRRTRPPPGFATPPWRMTSALNSPTTDSASALSSESLRLRIKEEP